MSRRFLEADAKQHLFPKYEINVSPVVVVTEKMGEKELKKLVQENPWLETSRLVVKPNELFGRRGKLGLVKVNLTWPQALEFINDNLLGRELTIDKVKGTITRALVEKFTPHKEEDEFMVSIKSVRQGAEVSLSMKGGMNVDADWEKNVKTIIIPAEENPDFSKIGLEMHQLVGMVGFHERFSREVALKIVYFLRDLYKCFDQEDATLVQINPFTIGEYGRPIALDARVELDQTAGFLHNWPFEFPAEFGQEPSSEEARIAAIDEDIGGSVKLKIINRKGLIWFLTAGGGGSIIFVDTAVNSGYGAEIGNYAEYSGDPPEEAVFPLAEEIIKLATTHPTPKGKKKYLFVGGGIANFTDVKTTFAGIIRAIRKYAKELREHRVEIWVRRGGPNWEAGLQAMKDVGKELGLEIYVYGPDVPMTRIVTLALGGASNE